MDAMPAMCYEIFFQIKSKVNDTQILDDKYMWNRHEYIFWELIYHRAYMIRIAPTGFPV
jgi:hypothetical protein